MVHTFSSQVRFLKHLFQSKLSKHIRQSVSLRLINIDITPKCFAELFRWSHALQLTLQHEISDFPSKGTKSWEWSYSLHYTNTGPDNDLNYAPDFLHETIARFINIDKI